MIRQAILHGFFNYLPLIAAEKILLYTCRVPSCTNAQSKKGGYIRLYYEEYCSSENVPYFRHLVLLSSFAIKRIFPYVMAVSVFITKE